MRWQLIRGRSANPEISMKTAFVALMMLALLLTGLGLFGIADFLISMPGWEAVKTRAPPAGVYKEYLDSLDRSRDISFLFSLLCFTGGLGLGVWVSRTYFRGRSAAGAMCNICGA